MSREAVRVDAEPALTDARALLKIFAVVAAAVAVQALMESEVLFAGERRGDDKRALCGTALRAHTHGPSSPAPRTHSPTFRLSVALSSGALSVRLTAHRRQGPRNSGNGASSVRGPAVIEDVIFATQSRSCCRVP